MKLGRVNVLLDEAGQMLGSPKSRLRKAGYEIVSGKMTTKAKRIVKKVAGQFGVEVLKALGHTVVPVKV